MTEKWGPITVIEWQDSSSMAGSVWKDTERVREHGGPSNVRSVGWVLKEDKHSITLAGHASENQCSGDLSIPKSVIKRRWSLVDPGRKKSRVKR